MTITTAVFSFLNTDILAAIAIFAASLVLARLSGILMEYYKSKIASKTQTTLDDDVIAAMEAPAAFAIILIGLQAALFRSNLLFAQVGPVNRIFYSLWVVMAAFFTVRMGNALLKWFDEKAPERQKLMLNEIFPIIRQTWRLAIVAIAALMILDSFDVRITPLLASLGIAGIAVALAAQDSLANFFAGVYLAVDKPVQMGDYIGLDIGAEGYVERIGWRSTRIRNIQNNMVIVPNGRVAQSIITNYHYPSKEMALAVECSVAYGSDLEKVEKTTVEVAKKVLSETKGGVKSFAPFVRYGSFGDSGIVFSVILRVEEFADKSVVKHEFIKALHERYKKEGIEIPYPKRHVYLEDIGGGGSGKKKPK